MYGQNDFEKQVEQEERAYTDPTGEFTPADEADPPAGGELMDKIKELVQKGHVTRIVVKRNDKVLANISLNTGILGGLIGFAAAPWAMVAAAVAAAGFACKVELVKDNGEVIHLRKEEVAEKAKDVGAVVRDVGSAVAEGVRNAMHAEDPDIEVIVEEEPAAAPDAEIDIPVDDAP